MDAHNQDFVAPGSARDVSCTSPALRSLLPAKPKRTPRVSVRGPGPPDCRHRRHDGLGKGGGLVGADVPKGPWDDGRGRESPGRQNLQSVGEQ